MSRLAVASILVLASACGGPIAPSAAELRSSPPPASSVATTDAGTVESVSTEDERLKLFQRLVGMVRAYHVFSPNTEKNLGKTWEESVPVLKAEFAAARTDAALSVALVHFGNSLHDVHCVFRPARNGPRIRLWANVGVERVNGAFQFYVDSFSKRAPEALKKQLAVGDILESVDGVPARDLVKLHEFDSNMNDWELIALDTSRFLTWRRTVATPLRDGAISTWVVRPRAGGPSRTVEMIWSPPNNSDEGDDTALDYASNECVSLDKKTYGAYSLTGRGYRSCVYTSTAPKYRDYPIVRHTSFRYDEFPHGPLTDFEMIRAALAKAKPKGVIVDVQENAGGMNPNLFLEWWADKPYVDSETHMVLSEALANETEGTPTADNMPTAVKKWYAKELHDRASNQRFTRGRPFMCKSTTCEWDNHYAPTHRVTKAPVAVIVGPGCASSCDAFVWHFSHERFGPLVGRRPMAGYTTHRTHIDLSLRPGGPNLGRIDFASSFDTAPGDTVSIEGASVPLDAEVPLTFENRETFDRLQVDAAIRELEKRH